MGWRHCARDAREARRLAPGEGHRREALGQRRPARTALVGAVPSTNARGWLPWREDIRIRHCPRWVRRHGHRLPLGRPRNAFAAAVEVFPNRNSTRGDRSTQECLYRRPRSSRSSQQPHVGGQSHGKCRHSPVWSSRTTQSQSPLAASSPPDQKWITPARHRPPHDMGVGEADTECAAGDAQPLTSSSARIPRSAMRRF